MPACTRPLLAPGRPRPAAVRGLALLLLCLACSAPGCGGAPRELGTSLVVVTIDTLRADHLSCYGYFRETSPRLDALAAEGVLFEQVYAPMATTLPSHASLFTGLFPLEHSVLANTTHGGRPFAWRQGARTLAQLAEERDFATGAFVSAAPLKRHSGLQVGFDEYDQPEAFERPAQETVDAALAWVRSVRHERVLLWVHLYDPHAQFEPPPAHDLFRTDAALEAWIAERGLPTSAKDGQRKTPLVTRDALNGYDGEIHYADAEVGRLVDELAELGVLERAVVVVTADHGEGLNQHDWPAHGHVYGEQLHIPLIVRLPSGAAARDALPARFARLVSTVDILPTVLPFVDRGMAEEFAAQASGFDVLAADFEERPLFGQRSEREGWHVGPMYTLTTPEWRYHFRPEEEDLLFERESDPHELQDVGPVRVPVADELRREVLQQLGHFTDRARALGEVDPNAAPDIDPQLVDELEALGYLGGDE